MVETSSCNSRMYPTFEAPVDPRYGAAYSNANAPQMTAAEAERWPLRSAAPAVVYAQPDPYNVYYVPPSYGEPPNERHCHHQNSRRHRHEHRGCKGQGFVLSTLRLGLFHAFNALLGIFAFVAVVTGVHLAIGLIPLCCVGLLVFRGVVILVQWLAKLDVKLSSYVASPGDERVLVADADQPLGGFEGLRLSPELAYFSPVSLLGALYFSTVKFVMSILSLVVVSVFASLPVLLLAYGDDDDTDWLIKVHHHKTVDLRQYPFTFYVIWGCLFILVLVAMHVVAWLSRALTHFFCCERMSASEYTIPIVQYPEAAATATMYGSSSIATTRTRL
ncbi:hypothetical protein PHYPSEUDO_008966 [Phytophthora pseudosyringae]|uniref:Sensor domain-containing protein n=1 Tax=Phytophthora pseudosyringae TaxID=221518 RepID=A0A8T1WCM7_9STRA|nr:hypothetical protein PHYPSEUDO_008966 [Phytophthora pseudosyringae]